MSQASAPGRGTDVALPTLAILAGSAAALLATLAARILMARALTPAELGYVLLAVALVSGVGGAASLGLASASGRRVADLLATGRTAEARTTGRSALAIGAASGAAAVAGLLLAAAVVALMPGPGPLGGILAVLAPVALGLAAGFAMVGVARGFGDFLGRPLIRDAGGGLARLVAIAVAVTAGGGPRSIALGFMIGSVASEFSFVAYGAMRGWLRREGTLGWDPELWRRLRPYSVMEVVNQLMLWADVLVLGVLGTPEAVGYYGVARSFSRALEIVHVSAAYNYLPSATAALVGSGRDEFIRVYVRTRTLVFALLWPLLAVSIAAPEALIAPLFGATYLPGAPLLRLLAIALGVQAIFGYKELALIALGDARSTAVVSVWSFGTGLLALVALVPPLGATGAAAAVLLMALARGVALARVLWRKAGIRPWVEDVPAAVVAAAVLTAAAWVIAALAGATLMVTGATVLTAAVMGSLVVLGGLYRARR
jgi:O-antigen/teichoic acid export membrane protein